MRMEKEILLTFSEVAAVGATLLLLPCTLAHLALGCDLTDILAEVTLGTVGISAILTGLAIRQGWYLDHLGIGQPHQTYGENDEKAGHEPIVRRSPESGRNRTRPDP